MVFSYAGFNALQNVFTVFGSHWLTPDRRRGNTWEEVCVNFKTLVLFSILASRVVSWEHHLVMTIWQDGHLVTSEFSTHTPTHEV